MKIKILLLLMLLMQLAACSSTQMDSEDKKADLYYQEGTSELVNKDYTKALGYLIKADELRPNDTKILNNLAMAYYFKNEYQSAEEYLKKAIKEDSKNSDARNNLASLYFQQKKFQQAELEYLKITKDLTYEGQFRVFHNLGLIELKKNNKLAAIKYFKKALEENSDYCASHYELGKISESNYNYVQAAAHYRDATQTACVNVAESHFKQVDMFIKMNEFKKAKHKLNDMVNAFSGDTNLQKQIKRKQLELDTIETNSKKEFNYVGNGSESSVETLITPTF